MVKDKKMSKEKLAEYLADIEVQDLKFEQLIDAAKKITTERLLKLPVKELQERFDKQFDFGD